MLSKGTDSEKESRMHRYNWHTLSSKNTLEILKSSQSGLSSEDATLRLKKYDYNEIIEKKSRGDLLLFLDQFRSFLILLLIAAVIISIAIGEFLDAVVIAAVVMLNAVLSFLQVKKAEAAVSALKKISVPNIKVVRDGKVKSVLSREIVPGDILLLEIGDRVPADCRILQHTNLKVDESILTGESVPVVKNERFKSDVPINERKNMLFAGTSIVYGRCEAIVVLTGMSTEFGKIAETLQEPDEETPLQKKIDLLGGQLGLIFVAASFIVFLLGLADQIPLITIFITAVALAVAAVPESLLASITLALAIGIDRMAKRKAIVKRLTSVEGLGNVTVICSDKTGTLTVNEMTVRKVWTLDSEIEVSGEGYGASGTFSREGKHINPLSIEGISKVLNAGLICNDAFAEKEFIGDPTEIALLVSAKKAGLSDNRRSMKRIGEIPFDSERKIMSVFCETKNEGHFIWTKGAVEEVLKRCSFISVGGKAIRITERDRKRVLETNRKYASNSLRVLGFAMKKVRTERPIEETDMVFLGMQAMIDPPRKEAKKAIEACKAAGIKVVMITGDHRDTAVSVAKELNLINNGLVLSGEELDKMNDHKFDEIVNRVAVYARVTPDHKVRILEALKRKGHVVAMTGDGINDAPALKRADIGISMGMTGTDVARETSDIVISDDNFATIVSAVEEGRGVYSNIRKTIALLISGNIAEVGILLIGVLFGLPLPLIAIQLLWINLITDGFPALAMSVDPINKEILSQKPRSKEEKLTDGMRSYLIGAPILMTLATIGLFFITLNNGGLIKAQTVTFTTVIVTELLFALSCRSLEHPIGASAFDNKYLVLTIVLSLILQFAILYLQPLNLIFHVVPLGVTDWLEILAVAMFCFLYLEASKTFRKIQRVNSV